MFTVDALLNQYYPHLTGWPLITPSIRSVLRRLLREEQFVRFAEQYPHLQGMDFVEQVLETLQFTYTVSDRDRENIPVSGRVMIIANHPIGSLDGLALLRLVHDSRPDVRIVANDLLETVAPLRSCLLSVKVMTGVTLKEQITRIDQALADEEAVIIFPAGEVSRFGPQGIRDGRWQKGFLRLAARAKAPILPIHVHGRNSLSFYVASLLLKPLSTLMLIGEMFRRQRQTAQVDRRRSDSLQRLRRSQNPGKGQDRPVPQASLPHWRGQEGNLPDRNGHCPAGTADCAEERMSRPGSYWAERRTARRSISLKATKIRRCCGRLPGCGRSPSAPWVRARANGGTLDGFDRYYRHLVLWSAEDLEIVGAYRLARCSGSGAGQGMRGSLQPQPLSIQRRIIFPTSSRGWNWDAVLSSNGTGASAASIISGTASAPSSAAIRSTVICSDR